MRQDIKKGYYYLFYKLYKFWETAPAKFWSDFKAGVSIIALELWLLFLIFNIRSLIMNQKLEFEISHPVIIVPFLIIIIGNYILFVHTDKWKEYNAKFEQLPKKKNMIGGIIVWIIIILIIVSYWGSAYLVQKNVLGM